MKHITSNAAKKDFNGIIDNVIKYGNSVSISTDDGAAILVNQDEWNGLIETLYLQSIPGMKKSISEGKAAPLSDCLDSVGWDID
ncbi:MAG: type II toxin-antitoxin system Phd/YefM family antitoxin [Chitinispirillales bacterium]|nr:type II toxin-antitoxin system Phd/YefM family antitoxin [Chitinispirillales bacterium]